MQKTTFIFTGGTIDSYYDPDLCTPIPYNESIIPEYMRKSLFLDPDLQFEFVQIASKDSRDIDNEVRDKIVEVISKSEGENFIITHGTFTLFQTAQYIASKMQTNEKKIILTGSMVPLSGFYHSDGHFNLGFALGSLQAVGSGVWVCIKGKCYRPDAKILLH